MTSSSWVRSITSPFRKACTFFNQQQQQQHPCPQPADNKSHRPATVKYEDDNRMVDLHGEVMACTYEDVQVMWSILDKTKPRSCNIAS